MTPVEFVSNVGGLLGLFIGFSLISGVEVLYWLTIGYAENKFFSDKNGKGGSASRVKVAAYKQNGRY